MKNTFIAFIIQLIFVSTLSAQSLKASDTLTYTGTRLTHPLVEGWIKEFNKSYPGVTIIPLPKGQNADKADIKILAYNLEKETFKPGETYVVVSNYAQLPIANSKNPLLHEWLKKGLTEAEFKKLYFKTSQEDSAHKPAHHTVNIYTREKPVCATKAFASHYGSDPNSSKGFGVAGDDRSLLAAVLKDSNGVSYNNLGFIYDLHTRKLVDGITVIPVDINENGKVEQNELIYGNLDELISTLESGAVSSITVDKVNIVYNTEATKKSLPLFIDWVRNEGRKVNHQYGFLNIDTDVKILSLRKDARFSNSK